jgi:serine/threonine-protein kinase
MTTTTILRETVTRMLDGRPAASPPNELLPRYTGILQAGRCHWTEHHRFTRMLGSGGQGVVYLTERRGADDFTLPVAIKIFSPERYPDARCYDESMSRIAHIAARVAQIQQDNLLDVHNFLDRNRIRLMEMEWIDGYDLRRLLTNKMLERARQRVSNRRWDYINNVIVTAGHCHPRLKPGIAIAILRECLAALAALHREGIVHGDLKPSNIMLKRTGNAKVIDIGSAFDLDDVPSRRTCTPPYAAPEVLEGAESTPRSDLCSLGYVLIEMLAGQPPFPEPTTLSELLEAKRTLIHRLPGLLPEDVARNDLLLNFCRTLISPDPMRRFSSAEEADLQHQGAASFHRQLVKFDLASEYENEIRLWLEELD